MDKNGAGYRIGELADTLDLNPRTIRYYERIGIMPEPRRSRSGYRLYDEADRERLIFILKAKAIGLTLEEIRQILQLRLDDRSPCEHVVTLLDSKIAEIDRQRRTLLEVRNELVGLRESARETGVRDGAICRIIEQHQPVRPDGDGGR